MVEAKTFFFNLCYQVSIGLAVLCLPVLRYYHPEWERPIKVNYIFPVVYILATIFIMIFPALSSALPDLFPFLTTSAHFASCHCLSLAAFSHPLGNYLMGTLCVIRMLMLRF